MWFLAKFQNYSIPETLSTDRRWRFETLILSKTFSSILINEIDFLILPKKNLINVCNFPTLEDNSTIWRIQRWRWFSVTEHELNIRVSFFIKSLSSLRKSWRRKLSTRHQSLLLRKKNYKTRECHLNGERFILFKMRFMWKISSSNDRCLLMYIDKSSQNVTKIRKNGNKQNNAATAAKWLGKVNRQTIFHCSLNFILSLLFRWNE